MKKIKKAKVKRINKKRFSIFIIILVVIIALALALIFRQQVLTGWHTLTSNTFEWHGMEWSKEKFGGITVYRLNLRILRPDQEEPFFYSLYLRNDPRKLEKIPADVTKKLPEKGKVWVSFDKGPLQCNETVLASYKLGEFIDALGRIKEGAVASPELLNNTEHNWSKDKVKTCDDVAVQPHTHKVTSVVLLKSSDMPYSYIHQQGYCYILEIHGCESVETAERFILALIDVMKQEPQEEPTIETTEEIEISIEREEP